MAAQSRVSRVAALETEGEALFFAASTADARERKHHGVRVATEQKVGFKPLLGL
jgi:hypothetical protein